MEERGTLITLALIAATVWVGSKLLTRQARAMQAQGATIDNPIAKVAGWIAGKSDSFLSRGGTPGRVASAILNDPVNNVVRGNVRGTVTSIATGGVSDVTRALGWNFP